MPNLTRMRQHFCVYTGSSQLVTACSESPRLWQQLLLLQRPQKQHSTVEAAEHSGAHNIKTVSGRLLVCSAAANDNVTLDSAVVTIGKVTCHKLRRLRATNIGSFAFATLDTAAWYGIWVF